MCICIYIYTYIYIYTFLSREQSSSLSICFSVFSLRYQLSLNYKVKLIDSLKEVAMQDNDSSFLAPGA